MVPRNPQWARDLAKEIQRTARDSAEALPRVEIGIITKISPEILIRPESGEVLYTQQDIVWGVDRKGIAVGDNVLLARDTSDNPVVVQVLDGNDPDPTLHVKGKALVRTVEAIRQQSRFWKAPVATLGGLNQTTTDADGTVRLVLASDSLYRWKASTDAWVEISGAGGGASAFADLTGSLAASQVVAGSLPLSKLSTDPLARANHTGTQLASTISDFSVAVQAISYTEGEVDGLLSTNSTDDRARVNHTGTQLASTISDFNTAVQLISYTEAEVDSLLSGNSTDDRARANHTGVQAQSTVTDLVSDLALKAPLASPALTGTPTGPTAALGTNTTQLATTAFVAAGLSNLVDAAPGTLDTLNELAAALGDDPNFATTVSTNIGLKVAKAGDTMSGNLAMGSNKVTGLGAASANGEAVRYEQLILKSDLASPTFTGVPAAPTAAALTNTTQLATTAFVTGAVSAASGSYQPLDSDLTTIAGLTATTDTILQSKAGAWTTRTPAQVKTDLVLVKADVGLGSVDNTSDADKPVSTAQQTALNLKANLASPTFTGTPTLPTGTIGVTQTAGNSTTALATTAFATTALNLKANLSSPTFTGTPTLPTGTIGVTQTAGNNTTALATTAFVTAAVTSSGGTAAGTTFTPTGNIAASNVQDALAELDSEKIQTSGGTMTGPLVVMYGAYYNRLNDAALGLGLNADAGWRTYLEQQSLSFGDGSAGTGDWKLSRLSANTAALAAGDDLRRPSGEDGTHADSMVRKAQLDRSGIDALSYSFGGF